MWDKCRQRRPPLRLIPVQLSRAAGGAVKKARLAVQVRAAKPDAKIALSFRAGAQRIDAIPFSLKQLRCPGCGAAETLNRHSKLYGNDPHASDGQAQGQRGQRVWCSNRGQRGGCGRTVSLFLAVMLPRHSNKKKKI